MTAEPKMEDLLASIRKAIHDDIGDVPAAAKPDVFKGSMRELRVKTGGEGSAAASEIQELRERISRNREAAPHNPPPPRYGESLGSGGDRDRLGLRRSLDPQPAHGLRPSYAEAELSGYAQPSREPPRRFSREAETVIPASTGSWRDEPPAYVPPPLEPPRYPVADPGMLSAEASASASAAFNRLADSLLNRAVGDRSLEDMTRELLRGMLKQWLDDNLPSLVERLVREEIERVARRGR